MKKILDLFKVLWENKREAGIFLFFCFSFWFIYGLGELAGTQSLNAQLINVTGEKTTDELLSFIENKNVKGTLYITDQAKLKDQFGNIWLITDLKENASQELIKEIENKGIKFAGGLNVQLIPYRAAGGQQAAFSLLNIVGKLLMFSFYGFLLWFILQQMKTSGISVVPKFMKRKKGGKALTTVKLIDVAGHSGPKKEVSEIIEYLREPERFEKTGARPPKGVMLYGPPGNGKTLMAKAIAGEGGAHFIEQNGANFMQVYVGVGASRVRELFQEARENRPCVIFIDEIDSVGGKRTNGGSGGAHDEKIQTINALLSELDGFSDNTGIVVIAATNRLETLDDALIRPGRFDRKVYIPLPSKDDRFEILGVHARKLPSMKADLKLWAERTGGYSAADLANLVNEAAMEAARVNSETVSDFDFEKAKTRILLGPRNFARKPTEAERKLIAYHEAGHAILKNWLLGVAIEKISILSYGDALGITVNKAYDDKLIYTATEIQLELVALMGGRAAEHVFLNQKTTGALGDMEEASAIARRAVKTFGLDIIGPYIPANAELNVHVEKQAGDWVNTAYRVASNILSENKEVIESFVAELLEHEELDETKLKEVLPKKPISLCANSIVEGFKLTLDTSHVK